MPLSLRVCDALDYSFFCVTSLLFLFLSLAAALTYGPSGCELAGANALLIVMQLIHGPGRLCLYLYSFATVASLVMRQFANAFFLND